MIRTIRGTQDFLDLSFFMFATQTIQHHLQYYHFEQVATPILEPIELFKRTLGAETDVVSKEMFTIATRDGGEQICLRPEGTAPIMRAYLEHSVIEKPWKVFSIGPMFRYERPQKGRYRQFHQVSIEIIDAKTILQDAYLIAMLDRLFQEKFLLENYALLINFIGCLSDRKQFKERLDGYLDTVLNALCDTCKRRKDTNILRVFDCKNPACKKLYESAPHITDELCNECAEEWQKLKQTLELLSISYTHKPTLVRGLDYYNKTVFEFVSPDLGAQDAFCGGGRYDLLASQLGAKQEVPACGAAIGIERLLMLLEPLRDTLPIPQPPALQVIIPLGPEQQPLALLVADQLQNQNNVCVDVLLEGSVKSMMRKANKMGAQHAIIIGEDEQKQGVVLVKNMMTGDERVVRQKELVEILKVS